MRSAEAAVIASGPDSARAGSQHGWLGVELRHLGALAAIAHEGSFRRAAQSLGYVQSAISGQIAQLERAVGVQLIERSSGSAGASLTDAGGALLGHVEEILARFDAARIDLGILAAGGSETVRLGVIEGVGERRLPLILAAFRTEFPGGRVVIDESHGDDANLLRLAQGELDLVIGELPLPRGPFDHVVLERDRYVLMAPCNSPLARQDDPVTPEQLARTPLIQPSRSRDPDRLATRLREALIDQAPWLRPQTAAAAQALVGAGLGSAIVPELAVDPDDPHIAIVSVSHLLAARTIVLVKHRDREYPATTKGLISLIDAHYSPHRPARARPGVEPEEVGSDPAESRHVNGDTTLVAHLADLLRQLDARDRPGGGRIRDP